jgi:hypothetical protein
VAHPADSPVIEHLPLRPSWDCAVCEHPWPCDPAKEHLGSTMGRTQLCLYSARCLAEALDDMPTASAGKLYGRFLGWSRHP